MVRRARTVRFAVSQSAKKIVEIAEISCTGSSVNALETPSLEISTRISFGTQYFSEKCLFLVILYTLSRIMHISTRPSGKILKIKMLVIVLLFG